MEVKREDETTWLATVFRRVFVCHLNKVKREEREASICWSWEKKRGQERSEDEEENEEKFARRGAKVK